MGLRESWDELGTGGKVAVGLVVGGVVIVVGIVLLVVLAAVLGSFVLGMGSSAGGGAVPPTVSMSTSYDAGAGTATVTHEAGDEIPADSLVVRVDGEPVEWTDPDGTVSMGDSTTVDASEGATVRVIWTGGDGEPATLYSDTVGE